MDARSTEATRCLVASAFLSGDWFRRRVLEHARSRPVAYAPEVGYDLSLVVETCAYAERRQARYDLVLVGLVALGCLLAPVVSWAPSGPELLVPLALQLYWIALVVRLHERGSELALLRTCCRQGAFDPDAVSRLVCRPASGQGRRPQGAYNLVVYNASTPFVGGGLALSQWSFDFDLSRGKATRGTKGAVIPFAIEDLYAHVEHALGALEIRGLLMRDMLYVRGRDIRNDRHVLPDPYARPVTHIDPRMVRHFMGRSGTRIRHYKWIQVHDWSSELVVSYFLRLSRRGSHALCVEVRKHVLTPLHASLRAVDSLLESEWRQLVPLAARELVLLPMELVAAGGRTGRRLREAVRGWLGTDARRSRREIDGNVLYDYGAVASLREQLAGGFGPHFFQKMDREMCVSVVESRLLATLVDFLEKHDVDTSELRARPPRLTRAA